LSRAQRKVPRTDSAEQGGRNLDGRDSHDEQFVDVGLLGDGLQPGAAGLGQVQLDSRAAVQEIRGQG